MGTVGYASPEQVQGQVEEVDGRTDLYALGALLYALVCGRPPCIEDAMSITEFMIATIERPDGTAAYRVLRARAP